MFVLMSSKQYYIQYKPIPNLKINAEILVEAIMILKKEENKGQI